MAYILGDRALAEHYNGFAASINTVWGVGAGGAGYGQPNTIPTVTEDVSVITASQWTTLLARMNSSANHQGTSIISISNPLASTIISAFADLNTNIISITNNKQNHGGVGTTVMNTIAESSSWVNNHVQEGRYTFAGGDEARYFFNSGGAIQVSFAKSGTTTTKDTDWNLLATAGGTFSINAQDSGKSGGSGVPSVNNLNSGYYDLTTAYRTIFKQFGGVAQYTYGVNNIQVEAKVGAAHGDGRGNNSDQIFIKVTYTDAEVEGPDDTITGTVTSTINAIPTWLTSLADTWGTPAFTELTNTVS